MFKPIAGPAYEYRTQLKHVVDGDTLDLDIDVGFDIHAMTRIRLLGINTPEVVGATKAQGLAASEFARQWLDNRKGEVLIRSYKAKQKEKYGRWLAEIWSLDGDQSLNQELLSRGFALPMNY
jgi:micrococcal nuclease